MPDDLEDLANAAVEVMGPSESLLEHHCRPGTWLFIGGAIAVAIMAATHLGFWWVALILFALGWAANEREERQIKARLAARRHD